MPFKKGDKNINRTGLNRGHGSTGSLKEYDRAKFAAMSEEDKEAFLKKIPAEIRYKMAEGNPHQSSDLEVKVPQSLIELLYGNQEGGDSEVAQ